MCAGVLNACPSLGPQGERRWLPKHIKKKKEKNEVCVEWNWLQEVQVWIQTGALWYDSPWKIMAGEILTEACTHFWSCTMLPTLTKHLRSKVITKCHMQRNGDAMWNQVWVECQLKYAISSIYHLMSQLEHYFKAADIWCVCVLIFTVKMFVILVLLSRCNAAD